MTPKDYSESSLKKFFEYVRTKALMKNATITSRKIANTASIGCASLRAIDDSGSHRTRVSLCQAL